MKNNLIWKYKKNDITDEERTEVIPQEASQMSESVKKEQIIYTWKYDAEIGWQLWKSEGGRGRKKSVHREFIF